MKRKETIDDIETLEEVTQEMLRELSNGKGDEEKEEDRDVKIY